LHIVLSDTGKGAKRRARVSRDSCRHFNRGLLMALAPVAAALAIGGSLIQGVSAIQQGNATAKAARVQAQEKQQEDEIAAQNTQITAEQQQAARMDDLSRTLGTIRAVAGSRNLDISSPSGMALEGAADTYAQRDVGRLGFNSQQTTANYRLAGQTAMATGAATGSLAQAAGYSSAFGSFIKAGTDARSAGWI
jgi:hypothetical protein